VVEARRQLLLELIQRRGFASLEDLIGMAGVSESTIRRDLEALDGAGSIRRTHGGAVLVGEPRGGMPAFEDRTASSVAEKRAIGALAAQLVQDGDTVLLDGGTTTLEVARALVGRRVHVVTNSLPIAQLLAPHKDTDLILIGGFVYPRTGVALGPIAIRCLEEIRVHTLFMGAGGIVADGIYNSNLLLVETERAMMRSAHQVVLVADHTKFGKQALARLCGLEDIQRLVVDAGVRPEHRRQVESAGVILHEAPAEPGMRSNPVDLVRTQP
jgi:DeoR/GlpR family transcriptional regulator of sugar metabolism